MSASSQSSSSSPAMTQPGVVDPLDLLDFSVYDGMADQSPSISPALTTKSQFTSSSQLSSTPSTLPTSQTMPGPSHQYDQYKQQTPFVPGALASTMAVNQNNSLGYNLDFSDMAADGDDMFDFNTASQSIKMDMDFEASPEASFFFPSPTTVNPIATQALPSPPTVTSNVGRMYPGMHQQAAKAQAQQRQQQQQLMQQQQRQAQPAKQQRAKGTAPTDPIVEQKISQLLNSMRSKSASADDDDGMTNMPRFKKDEDDMDEDERLLASEEGKKLSSKERRQLRNKVSARAFRSRRKEYITQLEAEIATKVTENGDLRAQNRALLDENRRLSDLSRMLLSSPSFSNFLNDLSSNPVAPQQPQPAPQQQVEQIKNEQRQMPKDVNPYGTSGQLQQQQIGMAMIPEQPIDFSVLGMDSDSFNYQPQVFTVLETPEMSQMDVSVLSGKAPNNEAEAFESNTDKVEIPVVEAPAFLETAKAQAPETPVVSEPQVSIPADLEADIFDDATPAPALLPEVTFSADLFSGLESEKASARYELVDASPDEAAAAKALMRVQRITASLEATMARLERLTVGL